jgi:hypothetical protein
MSASAKANRVAAAMAVRTAYHRADKVLKTAGHEGMTAWLSRMAATLYTGEPPNPRLVGLALRQGGDL